jgi:hypothetical protein
MRRLRIHWLAAPALLIAVVVSIAGCTNTPVDTSTIAQGPAPLREPPPESDCGQSYEDSLTGGKVFSMYCSYCHNAPSLAERPYAHFRNVAAHMRVRANLTVKEYDKLMVFLRRWHDVPPVTPPDQPTPKRFIYSQPIAELQTPEPAKDAKQPVLVAPQPVVPAKP